MANIPLPSPELLRQLLMHEKSIGKLFWRPRTASMFQNSEFSKTDICNTWNTKYSGNIALNTPSGTGYFRGTMKGKTIHAHRAIWAIEFGEWPQEVDHIDGNGENNLLSNLRNVSHAQNCRNSAISKDNTSGCTGVVWIKPLNKWRANLQIDGQTIGLGFFKEKDAAIAARDDANKKYKFGVNHGKSSKNAQNSFSRSR